MKFEILMMSPAWDLDVLIIVGDLLCIVMLEERRGNCNSCIDARVVISVLVLA
jgi:hypothetical protein